MWPLPVSTRTLLIVGAGVFAFAAGWQVNGWRLNAKHSGELKAMYAAGVKATERREVQIASLREQSLEDSERIARLSRGARVYACPDRAADRLPGNSNAGSPRDDRAGREDITQLLRQCLRSFGEVNRALSNGGGGQP